MRNVARLTAKQRALGRAALQESSRPGKPTVVRRSGGAIVEDDRQPFYRRKRRRRMKR
jgi:hypothetical protein